MKSLSKSLSTLFILLFCVGVAWSAYMLHRLPVALMEYSRAIDLIQIRQITPFLNRLYLVSGSTFATGVFAIVLLLITRQKQFTQTAGKAGISTKPTSESITARQLASDERVNFHLTGIDEMAHSAETTEKSFTKILSVICKQMEASQAAAFQVKNNNSYRSIELFASFARYVAEGEELSYRFGEGLIGQVAKEGTLLNIKSVPAGYLQIVSGLGKASPSHLLIIPVKLEDEVVGVVEIASFKAFTSEQETALQESLNKFALKLANNDKVSLFNVNI